MIHPLTGVIPVVPTIFHDNEDLDLAGLRRVVDFLIDCRPNALCILANYSEQFSLTDDERDMIARCIIDHNAGRLPIVVTTSHYSARVAAGRSKHAQELGADLVMLMPPFFGATMSVPDDEITRYFDIVASAIDIPIMIQDAPMSTTTMSATLLAHIAKAIPQVQYAKIEVPGTADKLRALIDIAGPALTAPFDGEESVTLIPDLDAGAVGTMSSSMVPDLLAFIVSQYREDNRDRANAAWEALLPLIHFENRQCGLRAQKILMAEGGIIASERTRAPLAPVTPQTRTSLIELASTRNPLVLSWAN